MIQQLSWRLSILACALAAGAGTAAAQTFNCTGTLPAGSYTAVSVPANATCNVSTTGNVSVAVNVTVGLGATLQDLGTATFTVTSSLLAVGASQIYLVPTTGGAVNILGSVSATGTKGRVDIRNSFIGGTLSVANSSPSQYINLTGNTVSGNLLNQNNITMAAGDNDIVGNAIGGSPVCTGNMPPPQDGGTPNTVGGNKVGQCSGL